MCKKWKRKIAGLISVLMLLNICICGNVYAADGTSDQSIQDSSSDVDESDLNINSSDDSEFMMQNLINYVTVDAPYLQTPSSQNIVVSYGDGSENITDAVLTYQKDDGSVFEMQLSKKDSELFLFKQEFSSDQTGVYELKDFKFMQDGIWQDIHLSDIGIQSMFGVNEEYPGYGNTSENTSGITAADIDLSVVDVKANNVENAEEDIPTAIAETENDVEGALKSRAIDKKEGDLTVVLDPGHGGTDGGATANGLVEKELTLKIAKYCKDELEKYNGVQVYMTRSDDTYLGIGERVDKAKELGADVLVSIHINSATPAANGAEVYYPNENYNPSVHKPGQDLAQQIQNQLVSLGLTDRGIKVRNTQVDVYPDGSKQDYYGIIRYAKEYGFPGIIVEHAFISNPDDAAKLADDNFLKKMGIADATGIAKTYGLSEGPVVNIGQKNDFNGSMEINISGVGSNGKVKIWHEETGKSKEYVIESGQKSINFNVADYNGLRGTYYIEAFNSAGQSLYKQSFYMSKDPSCSINVELDKYEKQYTVKVDFADMPSEVANVQVPVWVKGDQSDIRWINATQTATGKWQAVVNINDFKESGVYNVNVYATLNSGLQVGLAGTTFEVSAPSMSGRIENYNAKEGTFDVIIDHISSASGIASIQVPVWCASDQSDIKWYDAQLQNNGSYKVTVSTANHKYDTGKYKINVYLTAGNGICVGKDLGIQNVSGVSSDITVKDIKGTETQYRIQADNVGILGKIKGVSFAVWSKEGDQDDLVWYAGEKASTDKWQTYVDIRDHKTAGIYEADVYVTLADGQTKGLGSTTFEVTEPSISAKIQNYKTKEGTFDVIVNISNVPSGINEVQVPVWCAKDQSDILWYEAKKQEDGSYKAKVSIANHNFATGIYQAHVYTTTGNGITKGIVAGTQEVFLPNMEFRSEDINGDQTVYKLQANNVNLIGFLKNVMFAVWSTEGGQDDLVWYTGYRNSDGNWETNVKIKDHKSSGKYEVGIYAVLADGTMRGLKSMTFNVDAPTFDVSIQNYQVNKGTFDVIVNNIHSASGVDKIQVPVWCSADQSNIRWYEAQRQSDGSYKAQISMVNHKYATGTYQVHVYLTTGNGITKGIVTDGQKVTLPKMELLAQDVDGTETTFKLQATNIDLLGVIKNVMFATWSTEGGQDDLVWYTGHRNSDGNWEADVNISNHKTVGRYESDVYAVLADGSMKGIGALTFNVVGVSLPSDISIQDYDNETGRFTLVIPEITCPSGIDKLQVSVWCSEDKSDIRWYDVVKQNNGSYKVTVDPIYHDYHSGLYKISVYATAKNGIEINLGSASQMVSAPDYYTIMGDSTVTVSQMVKYFNNSGHSYPSAVMKIGGAPTIEEFCLIYLQEAQAEGVRVEVAFAQAMKETGWLQYGGIVRPEQFNFAGIGALDGNVNGECATFPDVRTGIRAHIQHLKAYASKAALVNAQVDPRFQLVKRGSAPYVEWLGIHENPNGCGWASVPYYGYGIVDMIRDLKK